MKYPYLIIERSRKFGISYYLIDSENKFNAVSFQILKTCYDLGIFNDYTGEMPASAEEYMLRDLNFTKEQWDQIPDFVCPSPRNNLKKPDVAEEYKRLYLDAKEMRKFANFAVTVVESNKIEAAGRLLSEISFRCQAILGHISIEIETFEEV